MSKIYLASSALIEEGFEGKRTIEEAIKSGFDGVQLFLDPRYHNLEYRSQIKKLLGENGLGVIFHLPNEPTRKDIDCVEYFSQIDGAKFLVHYEPLTELPNTNGVEIGWENSKTGEFDRNHVQRAKNQSREDSTFFVFDIGRIAYAKDSDAEAQDEILGYISESIRSLTSGDVLHVADKSSWSQRFRGYQEALGEGILAPVLRDIKDFEGIVVLEYEDLPLCISSLEILSESIEGQIPLA